MQRGWVGGRCTRGGGTGVYPPSTHISLFGIARAQPMDISCTYGSQGGVPGSGYEGPRVVSQAVDMRVQDMVNLRSGYGQSEVRIWSI